MKPFHSSAKIAEFVMSVLIFCFGDEPHLEREEEGKRNANRTDKRRKGRGQKRTGETREMWARRMRGNRGRREGRGEMWGEERRYEM
jgi:hypothetical protein